MKKDTAASEWYLGVVCGWGGVRQRKRERQGETGGETERQGSTWNMHTLCEANPIQLKHPPRTHGTYRCYEYDQW